MARYTEAVCRQCRREGTKLFIKGDKCYTDKCPFTKRGFVPGQHGHARPKKASEYGLQLREKQKARRTYGVLEKQFRLYFAKADAQKGVTGTNLLVMLERRFDNIVYRLGLAESRNQARQLVRHGHFTINGKKVNIPSYQVKAGDVVAVRENSRSSEMFKEISLTQALKLVSGKEFKPKKTRQQISNATFVTYVSHAKQILIKTKQNKRQEKKGH